MKPVLAGLLAGVPLAVLLLTYVLVRGKIVAAFFQSQDEELAQVSPQRMFFIILGGFVGMAFLFGALSGLVYTWLGVPTFRYVAFGAGTLFSLVAVLTKTPLLWDKIFWNLAIGGVLGSLVPILAL